MRLTFNDFSSRTLQQGGGSGTDSLKDRIDTFREISGQITLDSYGGELCVRSSKLGDVASLVKRIGSPSAFGETWLGCAMNSTKRACIKIAIKIAAIHGNDNDGKFTNHQLKSRLSIWSEVVGYTASTLLALSGVCPNLPIIYRYYTCPSCEFTNEHRVVGIDGGACLIIMNELADGDLKTLIREKPKVWNSELIMNCVFQVFAGLYALKKFFKMTHNDLHPGNILVKSVPAGGHWLYIIDGQKYYLPNLGYVFILWDLGFIHVPHVIRGAAQWPLEKDEVFHDRTDVSEFIVTLVTQFYPLPPMRFSGGAGKKKSSKKKTSRKVSKKKSSGRKKSTPKKKKTSTKRKTTPRKKSTPKKKTSLKKKSSKKSSKKTTKKKSTRKSSKQKTSRKKSAPVKKASRKKSSPRKVTQTKRSPHGWRVVPRYVRKPKDRYDTMQTEPGPVGFVPALPYIRKTRREHVEAIEMLKRLVKPVRDLKDLINTFTMYKDEDRSILLETYNFDIPKSTVLANLNPRSDISSVFARL
jgi:hypothetical protein